MAKYLVEVEYAQIFRCVRTIEAESREEAEANAEILVDDIPESEFEDVGYSEREAYVIDEL